jgi:hypothetical protein
MQLASVVLSLEIMQPGGDADDTISSSAEVRNGGAMLPLSVSIYGLVLNNLLGTNTILLLPFRFVPRMYRNNMRIKSVSLNIQ